MHTNPSTEARLAHGTHWGFGVALAGLYGVLRGARARPIVVGGIVVGTLLWAFADEVALPLIRRLGKAKPRTPSAHLRAAGAGLPYGDASPFAAYLFGRAGDRPRA